MVRIAVSVACVAALLSGAATNAWAEETPPSDPAPTTPAPTPPPVEPTPEPTATPVEPTYLPKRLVIGRSSKGRPIVAKRQGEPDAKRVLLVLGQMHGDEPYGRYVVDRLRRLDPRRDTAIWTIRTMNPDGARLRTRRNANRVDLNRNFPGDWRRGAPGSLYYSGPRPASEPETRAFIEGVGQIRPDAVVSYHQRANVIDRGRSKKARKWVRRLSRDLRLPISRVSCVTKCAGTLTGWFNGEFRGWAVTVELPRRISVGRQKSMARAMVRLAPDLKPVTKR
jgi:murein peptide amidase A